MKYLAGLLLPLSVFLAACCSQFPLVKPGKVHQRYFPNTKKILVYSIAPPSGPWRYIEPKYHATGNIAFIGRVSPYQTGEKVRPTLRYYRHHSLMQLISCADKTTYRDRCSVTSTLKNGFPPITPCAK